MTITKLRDEICEQCEENTNKEKCMFLKTNERETKWYCTIHIAECNAYDKVEQLLRDRRDAKLKVRGDLYKKLTENQIC